MLLNKKAVSIIKENSVFQRMIDQMEREVCAFFTDFSDDPSKISAWGHHYFCPEDGARLHYDRNLPDTHICESCGEVYKGPLYGQVWNTMYRNEAAVNCMKSGVLYAVSKKEIYAEYVVDTVSFYAQHYHEFPLHVKEGEIYESIETMRWGCGKIMPQGLNESIFIIRLVVALELIKDFLTDELLSEWNKLLFREVYKLLKPQVNKIHNIPCWNNSCIGVMGHFLHDQEMLNFVYEGEFNIRRQLREGVTEDRFWFEGSIHYNFFTLEGISYLLLFSHLYGFDFGPEEEIVREMYIAPYYYAFDNFQLPNPNDGWPNLNLKTYSYIYAIGSRIFSEKSEVANLFKLIFNAPIKRQCLPLSRPYYFKNKIPLEMLMLIPEFNMDAFQKIPTTSRNFEQSNFAILKNDRINIFVKYGHNGPSHAHPDKMNLEVVIDDYSLSRDLSNSGYGNIICNEWHRQSLSHNTVIVGGKSHLSTERGRCIYFADDAFDVAAYEVYPGVDFRRKIFMYENGFEDSFSVIAEAGSVKDYVFHVEADLIKSPECSEVSIGFKTDGYQHLKNVRTMINSQETLILYWKLHDLVLEQSIALENKKLYLAESYDNPIEDYRRTVIIRSKEKNPIFSVRWKILDEHVDNVVFK